MQSLQIELALLTMKYNPQIEKGQRKQLQSLSCVFVVGIALRAQMQLFIFDMLAEAGLEGGQNLCLQELLIGVANSLDVITEGDLISVVEPEDFVAH